jgi:hypothetical protein
MGIPAFTAVILASTIRPTGTPRSLMASKVVNPTVAFERKAFNQVLKNDMMTKETTSPMTTSNPIIIHSNIILWVKVKPFDG